MGLKNRKHGIATKVNSNIAWHNFQMARNLYFNEIKRIKKEYHKSKLNRLVQDGRNNPKSGGHY